MSYLKIEESYDIKNGIQNLAIFKFDLQTSKDQDEDRTRLFRF